MNAPEKLPADFSDLFGSGLAEHLQELGHDILEGERQGCTLRDSAGKKYLDLTSSGGIYNLGRRDEVLAQSLREAMQQTDQGNFPMISREKALLAERLTQFVPGSLDCAVFSVTRGETIDFACKLARGATRRTELIHLDGSYHGETGFALSLSDLPGKEQYGPLLPQVKRLPWGDLNTASSTVTSSTAAVFIEPIQAENGCRAIVPSYAQGLQAICREKGALLIVDETQTGFGRTGHRFAFEALKIDPDVLILGESLGGGFFPIAATLFRQQLNDFLNAHPMIHLSTFGGSDVGCRVALKALERYEKTRPWDNAANMGEKLLSICKAFSPQGQGLLAALDLTSPGDAIAFCRSCADKGLLLLPGKIAQHTVILRPPLTLNANEIQQITDTLRMVHP